jgi:hypothetical protein
MSTVELPSAAFRNRELNGTQLLDELAELRSTSVSQRLLDSTAAMLAPLRGLLAKDAQAQAFRYSKSIRADSSALAELVEHWGKKLKTKADVVLFIAHFEKLALTSALLSALRQLQATHGRGHSRHG